jgi:hypothetical protein
LALDTAFSHTRFARGLTITTSALESGYPVRVLGEASKYLLITFAILYALDWTVFEVRHMSGGGMGTVMVEQYLSTNLKGNKAEYDYLGTANQSCSRTLFPQYAASAWNSPCWWLERHKTSWQ